jgi:hypothetical protein
MGAYVPIQQDREPGWFETLGQIYQNRAQQQLMQARQQEMQARDQEMRQQQRSFQDDQEIRRALGPARQADGTLQPRGIADQVETLYRLGTPAAVKQAQGMQKAYTEQQTADAGLTKANLENHKMKLDLGGQIVNGMVDQPSYDAGVPQLEQLGILHPGSAPPIFDPKAKPAFLQSIQNEALTVDQHLSHLQQKENADREEREFLYKQQHDADEAAALAQYRNSELGLRRQSNAISAQNNTLLNEQRIAGIANQLRGDYMTDSKAFRDQTQAYNTIQSVGSGSAVDDLALIYGVMKLYDPGSTVREGEFANAANASGVPGWIRNLYNQAQGKPGYALRADTRKQFLDQSQALYERALQQHEQLVGDYSNKAHLSGIEPERVIVDYNSAKPWHADDPKKLNQPPASGKTHWSQYPPAGSIQDGYRFNGGDPANPASWEKVKVK